MTSAIIINDANILIDLLKLRLVDAFFQLPYAMHATEEVMAEIQEPNNDDLYAHRDANNLIIKIFDIAEMAQIGDLLNMSAGLSFQDCTCIFYSEHLTVPLLTGDKQLRKTAEKRGICVYGILWVLDQLVTHDILGPQIAKSKLKKLMELNPRLPQKECQRRLKRWDI